MRDGSAVVDNKGGLSWTDDISKNLELCPVPSHRVVGIPLVPVDNRF